MNNLIGDLIRFKNKSNIDEDLITEKANEIIDARDSLFHLSVDELRELRKNKETEIAEFIKEMSKENVL